MTGTLNSDSDLCGSDMYFEYFFWHLVTMTETLDTFIDD